MTDGGLLDLLIRVGAMLDDLDIPYALGGSLASSFFGEPRATADIDVAIRLSPQLAEPLLQRASVDFYVPMTSARAAIEAQGSFNLLVESGAGGKVDLFVLGDGLLDRRQIERRLRVGVPGAPDGLWVTSPEDQILRKLEWYVAGGSTSDRQWRDVVGLLASGSADLDVDDVRTAADHLDLRDLLERAILEASDG